MKDGLLDTAIWVENFGSYELDTNIYHLYQQLAHNKTW